MLYSSPNARMQLLVRTFSIPALKVETRQWLSEKGRERLKNGMQQQEKTVLYVKETGNTPLNVLSLLNEYKPFAMVCLMMLRREATVGKKKSKILEAKFYT